MKTSELIGPALIWAVAKCKGIVIEDGIAHTYEYWWDDEGLQWEVEFDPLTNWSQGGPIIEREMIATEPLKEGDGWCACLGCTPHDFLMWDQPYSSGASYGEGPTPLIAAMRCYVASKLGDEVDIPKELLGEQ